MGRVVHEDALTCRRSLGGVDQLCPPNRRSADALAAPRQEKVIDFGKVRAHARFVGTPCIRPRDLAEDRRSGAFSWRALAEPGGGSPCAASPRLRVSVSAVICVRGPDQPIRAVNVADPTPGLVITSR